MMESYRQRHDKKQSSATQRLGILLGAALAGFLVLGLVLRALGAGTVLFGAALFALGWGLGWFTRGRKKQPNVAVLPLRPRVEEAENSETVNLARAYADEVIELNTPSSLEVESTALNTPDGPQILVTRSSKPETGTVVELEGMFSQTFSNIQTPQDLAEATREAPTFERKKWSPKNKVESPSSVPELHPANTLEPEPTVSENTQPLDLETVPFEPKSDRLEPALPERKKWTPKSKAHDTLSEADLSTLEPTAVFESAALMLEASGKPLTPARKKWTPKIKQDVSGLKPTELEPTELEPPAPTPNPSKTALEIPPTQSLMRPVIQTTMEPGPPVMLDSRGILEAMGIRLPFQNTSTGLPRVEKLDSSESPETNVPPSSGRKKWVPKRKL